MSLQQPATSEEVIQIVPALPPAALADALLRLDVVRYAKSAGSASVLDRAEETLSRALKHGGWILLCRRVMDGADEKWFLRANEWRDGAVTQLELQPNDDRVLPSQAAVRLSVRTSVRNSVWETVCFAVRGQTDTVYGIMDPETRALLSITDAGYRWQSLIDFTPGRNQDGIEEEFLEWARLWYAGGKVRLGTAFPVSHFTAGASQALEKLLCPPLCGALHVFEGEYEGAKFIAEAYGLAVTAHARRNHAAILNRAYGDRDVFYVSAPSAIDGQYDARLPKLIADMAERHPCVKFVVDITYVGLVQRTFRLKLDTLPNVEAVVCSLSKTFGVYYERIGGVFLRKERAGFGGLGWFKNVRSIVIGLELMWHEADRGGTDSICRLPKMWRKYQRKAIALHKACGLLPKDARPSNASLLALSDGPPPIASVNGFPTFSLRDGTYRYCLSATMWHLMREDERMKKEGK